MTPPPHLSPAPPVLQQQMVETRRQLVVGDALTKATVIVLLQPPVQHHLQLTCTGDSSLNDVDSTFGCVVSSSDCFKMSQRHLRLQTAGLED